MHIVCCGLRKQTEKRRWDVVGEMGDGDEKDGEVAGVGERQSSSRSELRRNLCWAKADDAFSSSQCGAGSAVVRVEEDCDQRA